MVCTVGRGRMACMARLLEVGNLSENSEEEAIKERITIQRIYDQFSDTYEPNLLDEKDMLIYDSRPLTDPLHLVCCNVCEKPVKASQFTAHAERCKTINYKEELSLGLDSGTDRKKPEKKGRKRGQATNGRAKQKSKPADKDEVVVPELNLNAQNGIHSLSGEVQSKEARIVQPRTLDAAARHHGVSDIPGPLAMKIYHLGGSHRLRAALHQLYQNSSTKQYSKDSTNLELMQENNIIPSRISYANRLMHDVHDDDVPQTKSQEDSLPISAFRSNSMRIDS